MSTTPIRPINYKYTTYNLAGVRGTANTYYTEKKEKYITSLLNLPVVRLTKSRLSQSRIFSLTRSEKNKSISDLRSSLIYPKRLSRKKKRVLKKQPLHMSQ